MHSTNVLVTLAVFCVLTAAEDLAEEKVPSPDSQQQLQASNSPQSSFTNNLSLFIQQHILHRVKRKAVQKAKKVSDKKTADKKAVHKHVAKQSKVSKKTHKRKSNHKSKKGKKAPKKLNLRVTKRKNSAKCKDKAENCNEFLGFCDTPDFTSILKDFCHKGCGHCAPEGKDCVDKFTTCKSWARQGFCKSDIFTKTTIRAMCAKTCKMCAAVNKPTAEPTEATAAPNTDPTTPAGTGPTTVAGTGPTTVAGTGPTTVANTGPTGPTTGPPTGSTAPNTDPTTQPPTTGPSGKKK